MARLVYFLVQALKHVRRSPIVAAVTVATVAVVFLLLGSAWVVAHNLGQLTERLETGLRLRVYLRDGADAAQVAAARERLVATGQVAELRELGAEEALARFRERLGSEAALLDVLGENPLPASLEVTLRPEGRSPAGVRALADAVRGLPAVEEVQFGESWLDRFFEALGVMRLLGWALGGLLVFATLLIVSNTIRLSVYARQEEIHILKLVGATDRFVKAPFYLEGALLGLVGAGLGLGLVAVLFQAFAAELRLPLGPGAAPLALAFPPLEAVLLFVAGGALVGWLGTFTSLWRHLRI
ncbi:MAG TPA: permease-like cell division protein FtsX [Myxococcota bacterium]|nr:permease-like cell division protein FtsX [Myxococcota bacterium]HRY93171.1 permease-like cell division protein FtsX [Myxococcota bacterium]HSA21674.1 permease-like cell division protein FtsX [Myxococcota bacterium]